jgi:cyclic pyranopterin phosphate synthase
MVDVGDKPVTRRRALAEARIELGVEVLEKLLDDALPKGNALAVATVAGVQAAKRTGDTVPLCHPLPLEHVRVEFESDRMTGSVRVICETATTARTGVEMEALCGVTGAALALYDMCKALHRGIRIESVRLLLKEGGKSGRWEADS